jgi:REP element-mobilizing transposase RayT
MTFKSFHDESHLYFVTASIVEWIHIFKYEKYASIVLSSLQWLQTQNKILLFAFVIMPSHLHLILKPIQKSIGEILQDFGSFTAHEILKQARKDNKTEWLNCFQKNRRDIRHEHSIWQDIQAKNIYSMEFLEQKMEYIHQNPIAKDWNLVKDRADYLFSSAGYYDYGRKPIIQITDIKEWLVSNHPPRTADGA